MKAMTKIFSTFALTALFVACSGADISFAPDANADPLGVGGGSSTSSTTSNSGTCSCEPGAKGDKGDTGSKGDRGDTGAQGIQGVKGDRGDRGETGAQGQIGPQGPSGKDGVCVVADPGTGTIVQGPAGPTGAQGPAGKDGKDGSIGPKGDPGTPGVAGPVGATGATGAVGPMGPAGAGLSKSAIYVVESGWHASDATATCRNGADVLLTGGCGTENSGFIYSAGPVSSTMSDPSQSSSWVCSVRGTSLVRATAVCLQIQ